MASQPTFDFFAPTPLYPVAAGWKVAGPSQEAAQTVDAEKGRRLVLLVLEQIRQAPQTADEIAQVLGYSVLYIRPRVSELVQLKQIRDSGMRRVNASGKRATVWSVR